jgi:predicted nucleic-acid-binding Zn-ribbon protein
MTEEINLKVVTFNVVLTSMCNNCGFTLRYEAEARTTDEGIDVCVNALKGIKAIHTVYLPEKYSDISKFDICPNCSNRPFKNKTNE